MCIHWGTSNREINSVSSLSAIVCAVWSGKAYVCYSPLEIVTTLKYSFPSSLLGKGPKMSTAILSRGILCGVLRTQKLKTHLFRTRGLKILSLKPGVGQYLMLLLLPWISSLLSFAFPIHSTTFFQHHCQVFPECSVLIISQLLSNKTFLQVFPWQTYEGISWTVFLTHLTYSLGHSVRDFPGGKSPLWCSPVA